MWNIFLKIGCGKCWFVMLWKLFHQIKFNEPFFYYSFLLIFLFTHTHTNTKKKKKEEKKKKEKILLCFVHFHQPINCFGVIFHFKNIRFIQRPYISKFFFHTRKYILLFLSTFKLILQNKLNKLYCYTYVQHIAYKA